MNKILKYQSILQTLRNILVQPVKLFQRGYMAKWRSDDFQYKPGAYL